MKIRMFFQAMWEYCPLFYVAMAWLLFALVATSAAAFVPKTAGPMPPTAGPNFSRVVTNGVIIITRTNAVAFTNIVNGTNFIGTSNVVTVTRLVLPTNGVAAAVPQYLTITVMNRSARRDCALFWTTNSTGFSGAAWSAAYATNAGVWDPEVSTDLVNWTSMGWVTSSAPFVEFRFNVAQTNARAFFRVEAVCFTNAAATNTPATNAPAVKKVSKFPVLALPQWCALVGDIRKGTGVNFRRDSKVARVPGVADGLAAALIEDRAALLSVRVRAYPAYHPGRVSSCIDILPLNFYHA